MKFVELNKSRPKQIQVIGVGEGGGEQEGQIDGGAKPLQIDLNLPFIEEWRDAIYAKIVIKCGDRRYWESWARDVAQIAERPVAVRLRQQRDGLTQHD